MKGRVALITGASRGIGAATAELFKKAGARVLTPSRSELDLSDNSSIERYISSVEDSIDILVNNAGINFLAGLEELDQEVLGQTLQVNLVAPLILTQLVAKKMKANRYGRVVNISSIWSVVAKERRLAYAASKSAMNGVTRTLAIELGEHGILVNAIAPGYVNTELTSQNNSPEQIQLISNSIPLHRLAEPAEIAEMAVFLCSEKNSYMTGQVLVVDGGYVCR
ncbi:MAG: SDR family NAD(P)-dependent oxidoreductase [Nitrosospira sp.]|nr:SDR family NAD(P)-dependent oxidoreductase [Nitrosospira sp.]